MNFWKRYPADYARKTARLTLAQHGAYTLLLDELYTAEAPLPADISELFRICRAMSKSEQDAVRLVADRFFPVSEDGARHNKRAAEEIEEAAPAIQAARENGKKGGRPRTQKEPSGFLDENQEGTRRKPRTKAPQSSDISSSLRSEENAPGVTDLIAEGFDERSAQDFIAHKAKLRAPLTRRAWDDHLREAKKAGWSPLQAAEKVMAKSWKGFEASYVASERPGASVVKSFREQSHDAAAARVHEMTGGILGKRSTEGVIDAFVVPARRLG